MKERKMESNFQFQEDSNDISKKEIHTKYKNKLTLKLY